MEEPLISVIVPIYNTAAYLARAVESIRAQTHKNLEIILINDGSTDSSGQVCNDFAKKDSRVKVIHQNNAGVSAARNAGLDAASGQWVGFVDSDDYINAEMFEKLLKAAAGNGKDISVCGYTKIHLDGSVETQAHYNLPASLSKEDALEQVLRPNVFEGFTWNKLFKRSLLEKHKNIRFDLSLHICEDLLFVVRLLLCSEGVSYVPQPLYNYCLHESGAVCSLNEKRETCLAARLKVLELVEPVSPRLSDYVKFGYANSALSLLYTVGQKGEHRPGGAKFLKNETFRFFTTYFFSGSVNIKMKIRAVLILISPKFSAWAWGIIKKRTNITWYS